MVTCDATIKGDGDVESSSCDTDFFSDTVMMKVDNMNRIRFSMLRRLGSTCAGVALLLLVAAMTAGAQPVADEEGDVVIGELQPDPSAVLDLSSTTKGLLIPRMTALERDNIIAPAPGLLIYNITESCHQFNFGTAAVPAWHCLVDADPMGNVDVLGDLSVDGATTLGDGDPGDLLTIDTGPGTDMEITEDGFARNGGDPETISFTNTGGDLDVDIQGGLSQSGDVTLASDDGATANIGNGDGNTNNLGTGMNAVNTIGSGLPGAAGASTTTIDGNVSIPALDGQYWALDGNATAAGDFLGTTNGQPLSIRTNGTERLQIATNPIVTVRGAREIQFSPSGSVVGAYGTVYNGNAGGWRMGTHAVGSGGTYLGALYFRGGNDVMTSIDISATAPNTDNFSVMSATGFTAVGTRTGPVTNQLHVISAANPARLEGLQTGAATDQLLTASPNGVLRQRTVASVVNGTAWALAGNAGTSAATDFVGTTDGQPLVLRTNSNEQMRLHAAASPAVSIGTSALGNGTLTVEDPGVNSVGAVVATSAMNGANSILLDPNNADHSGILVRNNAPNRNAAISFENGATASQWRLGSGAGGDFYIESGIATSGLMGTATSPFFIDRPTNRVGVGTNAPGGRLEVRNDATNVPTLRVRSIAGQTANQQEWFDPAGSLRTRIDNVGTLRFALDDNAGSPSIVGTRLGIRSSVDIRITTNTVNFLTPNITSASQNVLWRTRNRDVTFSSNIEPDLLHIDQLGSVGVGTTTPAAKLDVGGTGAIKVPVGTTAQRPLTPARGMIRFNVSTNSFEGYNGGAWVNL